MKWTVEQKDAAKRLWAEGWSSSQIGDELGFTRNAVIGAIHRMGLTRAGGGSKPGLPWKPRQASTNPKGRPVHKPVRTPVEKPDLPKPASPSEPRPTNLAGRTLPKGYRHDASRRADPAPVKAGGMVNLFGLEAGMCRFIPGDARLGPEQVMFCGAPVAHEATSYCPEHYALTFAPLQPRRRAA